uniref:hypothetical protein n=1 Tax=Catenuloplanes japonicus TaxID=33876 RepID=UPI0012F7C6E1
MGVVAVNARVGEPGHVFMAVRTGPVVDSSDPYDGVAFYDPQSGMQAKAPVDPLRVRFMEVPGTGVDVSAIEAAPRRTPAAERQAAEADTNAAFERDLAAGTNSEAGDPPNPIADQRAALLTGLTDEVTRLATPAVPVRPDPAESSQPAALESTYEQTTETIQDTLEPEAGRTSRELDTHRAAVENAEQRIADAERALRDLDQQITDRRSAVQRADSSARVAETQASAPDADAAALAKARDTAAAHQRAVAALDALDGPRTRTVQDLADAHTARETALQRADEAAREYRDARTALTAARKLAEQLRMRIDAAQPFPAVTDGMITARVASLGFEARMVVDRALAPQARNATADVTRLDAELNALRDSLTAAQRAEHELRYADGTARTRQSEFDLAATLLHDAGDVVADAAVERAEAEVRAQAERETADEAAEALEDAQNELEALSERLTTAQAALTAAQRAHQADPDGTPEPDDSQVLDIEDRIETVEDTLPGLEAEAQRTEERATEAESDRDESIERFDTALKTYQTRNAALTTALEAVRTADDDLGQARTNRQEHPAFAELEHRFAALGAELENARSAARTAAQQLADAQTKLDALETRIGGQLDLTKFGDRDDPGSVHSYLGTGTEVTIAPEDAEKVRTLVQTAAAPKVHRIQREAITKDIDRLTTQLALTGDLPTAIGKSGITHVVGSGPHALRVRLRATMERNDAPDVLPDFPTPELTQAENRKVGGSSNPVVQQSSNYRDLAVSFQRFQPLSQGLFRLFNITGTARITHGKYTRTTVTDIGAGQGTTERIRGIGFAHPYTITWSVAVEPASTPLPDPGAPARSESDGAPPADVELAEGANPTVSTPIVVNFPEHVAAPRPPEDTTPPGEDTLANLPMSMDSFHDPGGVGRTILGVLPRLAGRANAAGLQLDPESQREILTLSGFSNTHANLPRLRGDGLLSNPLRDADGKEIGILRLRAKPVPGAGNRIVSQSQFNPLEIYRQIRLQERGTTQLRNLFELSANIGTTIVPKPMAETAVAGTYGSASVSATGAMAHGTTHGTNTGASSEMGRGLRSGVDSDPEWTGKVARAMIADLDTEFTVELLTGGRTDPLPSQTHTWTGLAEDQEGMRARWRPFTLSGADQPRF